MPQAEPGPDAARGQDTLAAVLRGPESVFLYWTLEGARSAGIVERLGPDITWVLRMLDLENGTSERFEVDREAGNYYVDVRPGGTYGFELAAVAGDRWRTVARTGRVHIPERSVAPGGKAPGPGRRPAMTPSAERTAIRGLDVPGLHAESTPLNTGSSSLPARERAD
jgi:hypothetical protein